LPPAPTGRACHRRAKALPFFGLESCEHKPLPSACRRRCAVTMAAPPMTCLHTPPPGRDPVLTGQTCARALTRTRGRSPAYVPNQRRRAVPRCPPFSVPLPSARHQFCAADMAVPSVFGTHTNTRNRGAEPLLHLSVTMLDIPPCRHREPLRTGAHVSIEPSTPSSNLFGCLDPEHRRVPSRVGYGCTRSAKFRSIRIAASSVMDKP
jgi:hypothetical protein